MRLVMSLSLVLRISADKLTFMKEIVGKIIVCLFVDSRSTAPGDLLFPIPKDTWTSTSIPMYVRTYYVVGDVRKLYRNQLSRSYTGG